MKKLWLAALASGFLFALGLALAGMTNPDKIVAFLSFGSGWDSSLAWVMAGAVAVYSMVQRWVVSHPKPFWVDKFILPTSRAIDGRLLAGAALFGLGWGLGGFCPGPGLVSLVSFGPSGGVFVSAMLAGMGVFSVYERARVRALVRDPQPHPAR